MVKPVFRIIEQIPCHNLETFSALLALCAGNSPVTGEFPAQRPVTRSFDVFFDLRLNKQLSKQSRGWWFETPSCSLWRHCNGGFTDNTALSGTAFKVWFIETHFSLYKRLRNRKLNLEYIITSWISKKWRILQLYRIHKIQSYYYSSTYF